MNKSRGRRWVDRNLSVGWLGGRPRMPTAISNWAVHFQLSFFAAPLPINWLELEEPCDKCVLFILIYDLSRVTVALARTDKVSTILFLIKKKKIKEHLSCRVTFPHARARSHTHGTGSPWAPLSAHNDNNWCLIRLLCELSDWISESIGGESPNRMNRNTWNSVNAWDGTACPADPMQIQAKITNFWPTTKCRFRLIRIAALQCQRLHTPESIQFGYTRK